MIRIGLTGPSGTGKSSAGRVAETLGYKVIDCDKTAFKVSGFKEILIALEENFGDVVKDGVLDRKALSIKAFSTPQNTEKLNNIMLPKITEEIEKEVADAKESGFKYCLLDAPTLYESGADKTCKAVIAVLADEKIRAERIKKRDSLSDKALESRLKAGKPDSFYKEKTGHIIYNNGSEEEFIFAVTELLEKLKEN